MNALVVSVNGGFVRMHEMVLPVLQELGITATLVHTMADARSASGWDLALVESVLPGGGDSKVAMADCMPLLQDLSAARPGGGLLVLYSARGGLEKKFKEAYLAVPGVRGNFAYPFTEKTLKGLKKALTGA
jgi:hypothetical protein